MRKEFAWYFGATDEETKKIWESGILTLDANVLLDLYRYHENTRHRLLTCIESFKGRLWLSRQAAEEFFRNRSKVIISASRGFKQAADELDKIKKATSSVVEQLQANRIISTELIEKLNASIANALEAAHEDIGKSGEAYPNYFQTDPVLAKLLEIFTNAIGSPFPEDQLKIVKAEGEQRRKNGTPPGYLDGDKDGERPLGDFFLWRQILDHAKAAGQPLIFVTSERKDDWWERHSGQTVGPRLELLREAHDYSSQRVLIYQTDRFLQHAMERSGGTVDATAVEEIRAVDSLRSATTTIVRVLSQNVAVAESLLNRGNLVVELRRPIFKFTASGHFEPHLKAVPRIIVRLIESPQPLPQHRIGAGAGTLHDFNIHLKSEDFGSTLPAGQYVFEYLAEAPPLEATHDTRVEI